MEAGSLSDYFDCTFVINLPERRDRPRAIIKELQRASMPLSSGKVELFQAIKPRERLGFPNIGTRGCFLSHYHILSRALERHLANVLIVEDDLTLSPALKTSIQSILANLRSKNWGIAYFGHIENVPDACPPHFVPFYQPLITSHFYAVNGGVIPRLVDYLKQVQRESLVIRLAARCIWMGH